MTFCQMFCVQEARTVINLRRMTLKPEIRAKIQAKIKHKKSLFLKIQATSISCDHTFRGLLRCNFELEDLQKQGVLH
jgi:hypothetical protein